MGCDVKQSGVGTGDDTGQSLIVNYEHMMTSL